MNSYVRSYVSKHYEHVNKSLVICLSVTRIYYMVICGLIIDYVHNVMCVYIRIYI